MGTNALVLGGGGLLGICWETGVLAGLAEAGIDAAQADLIVGTSAGSVVGTQIASGRPIEELLAEHFAPRPGGIETNMEFDPSTLTSIFMKWATTPEMTPEKCAEIGAMALAAKTVSEERWVSSFAPLVGNEWPLRPLVLTAVDALSGVFQTWDRDSAVPIERAVASSCAVPGLFPAVNIYGRPYVDGGVRSGTSADLAGGFKNVVIIAPIGARPDGIDPLLGRQAQAEADALRMAGSRVQLLMPDAAALESIGVNRMDPTRRGPAAEAGVRQGKALAAKLDSVWSKAAA